MVTFSVVYMCWFSINPSQCDVWEGPSGVGGGSGSPPYLSWLRSKFWLKNHVSLKADIIYNSFGTFSEFFFKNHQKNWRKFKIYQKIAKNERKFQILYFLSYFNMQYLKRKHFSHRIQFHTGKVWFIWKNWKKSHFYFFLSKFLLTWLFQSQIFQICAKKF